MVRCRVTLAGQLEESVRRTSRSLALLVLRIGVGACARADISRDADAARLRLCFVCLGGPGCVDSRGMA